MYQLYVSQNIKDYKKFVNIVKPSAMNTDYNVKPKHIVKDIDIPIKGGLDPKILLTDYENLKEKAETYLKVFKDHPYIFNLGHGVLQETDPLMVKNLIDIVKGINEKRSSQNKFWKSRNINS